LWLTTSNGFFLSRRNPIPNHPAFGRLALQHTFRHYCGSGDMRAAGPARGTINANQKHMRNAA
jgi:hypothetical protein